MSLSFYKNYVTDNEILKFFHYVTFHQPNYALCPPNPAENEAHFARFLPPSGFRELPFDTGSILCYSTGEYEGNDEDMPRMTPPQRGACMVKWLCA